MKRLVNNLLCVLISRINQNYNKILESDWFLVDQIWELIGQFTHHACVIGQYASFMHAVIGQLYLNIGSFFHASRSIKNKWNIKLDGSFFLRFCYSFDYIGNRTSCRPILSVITLVINKLPNFVNHSTYDY